MPEYFVTWEIDISADSPERAAAAALKIQRDPESSATVFGVFDEEGEKHRVDLLGVYERLAMLPDKEGEHGS
ncbi:hypothetical protein LCGC14_0698610 [marine sediment metagenome]|uniref:Uncharacterized protein n=1 Tax=marine sediment metagenome TaxID=412755 RepID=A0A0F9R3W4_9ZZZZ